MNHAAPNHEFPSLQKGGLVRTQVTIFPGGSAGKASAYNVGDPGSIPGVGRSPGEGNGNPLQYPCSENPMDREAWGRKESDTTERLHFHFHFQVTRTVTLSS